MHPYGIARSISHGYRRPWLVVVCLLFCAAEHGVFGQGDAVQADVRARAEAAYAAGDLLGALPDYERLVSLFPEEACLHGRLAGCALKEPGRLALVRRHLRIALRKGCDDLDLGFHQARLAQLEYDFDRARDLYAAYLAAAGKKGRFKTEAEQGALSCESADWQPAEAVALEVFERIPADPDAAFRYYDPEVEGLRLVTTPASLRSKADLKYGQGRMALHDGDTVLVYSSLGKKGATGWDLYRVSIRQGAYTEPTLLERAINSEYDEKDAYLSKEGVLYYASNRPGGLGGFDIYAVSCGLDGLPTGQPYRLPYPINSVNDDVFFIPEAAGGAWMASSRAAVEGKIHAYRIGLGEGEMATGSVAWSADEVEGEGLKLRVFSGGAEVSRGDLKGDAAAHLSFSGDNSVRIILEDVDGNVVAESFGAGEGAWELKKTSSGWDLEDKSDVLADWAVLSDLQVAESVGARASSGAGSDVSETRVSEGWASWIGERSSESADATEQLAIEIPVVEDVTDAVAFEGDPQVDVDAEIEGAAEADAEMEGAAEADAEIEGAAEAVLLVEADLEAEGGAEVGEVAVNQDIDDGDFVAEESQETVPNEDIWASDNLEVLVAQVPDDPEVVEQLLATSPEMVVQVWEQRAEQILGLERNFLDEPDFNKAGALYDLIDQMDAWVPQSERMSPLLQDGVAIEDMREMLDEWSYAVQSASKASLAKVAGEAALALRRERLAIRELWEASDLDLTPIKARWSNWRDANRGMPGTRPEDSVMMVQEGELLLSQWDAVLTASKETWSRKEGNGWRGDWLGRQRVELDLNTEFWDENIDLAEEVVVELDPLQDGVNTDDAVAEVIAADTGLEVNEANGPRVPVNGDADVSLVAQLLPAMGGGSESVGSNDALGPVAADWSAEWDSAVAVSKDVARQWERLARASDGEGVAPVSDGDGFMKLTPAVRGAYLSLVGSVIEELEVLRADWQRDRTLLIEQWEVREFEGMARSEAMTEARALWTAAQQAEERVEALDRIRNAGEAQEFDNALAQREALAQAESAWRAWAVAWTDVMATMETSAEVAEEVKEEAAEAELLEWNGSSEVAELVDDGVDSDVQEMDSSMATESEGLALNSEEISPAGSGVEGVPENEEGGPVSNEGGDSRMEPATDPLNLAEVLENSSAARLERVADVMSAMEAMQRSDRPIELDATEREALSAWRERIDVVGGNPGASAGRAARMAWDKRLFFNERRLRNALNALDLDQLELKLAGEDVAEEVEVSVMEFEEARSNGGDLSDVADLGGAATAQEEGGGRVVSPAGAIESAPEVSGEEDREVAASVSEEEVLPKSTEAAAVARQDSEAASYGLILPEAEVWGNSSDPGRNSGLTLRPIDREAMERSILAQPFSGEPQEAAAERFSGVSGAPLAEGVEYKIQIGAFRKALPAALFAAFDPMWAQELSNGITRYMAGSFDVYDAAVSARDAIRALGYEDAFVVRFVDGERVRASRPEPALLAQERAASAGTNVGSPRPLGAEVVAVNVAAETNPENASDLTSGPDPLPTRREDIPTWDGIAGRVYSVQVGAFRGVPDAESMAALGTLTREDAGSDGWLRLFSGRFATQSEAEVHRGELRDLGRADAFIVVYINGRRIPLSQASLTAVASLPGAQPESVPPAVEVEEPVAPVETAAVQPAWCVELGVFNSTIPVRLANAILDAPLQWQIRSVRSEGLTRYRTGFVTEDRAKTWLKAAQAQGFSNAQLVRE